MHWVRTCGKSHDWEKLQNDKDLLRIDYTLTSLEASGQDWSPHTSFILKGSQIFSLQLKGWFKSKTSIQKYRSEIQISYWTCAWIIWDMFSVGFEELRIMNHRTLLLAVTMPYACWFLWRTKYIEDFKWYFHFQFHLLISDNSLITNCQFINSHIN